MKFVRHSAVLAFVAALCAGCGGGAPDDEPVVQASDADVQQAPVGRIAALDGLPAAAPITSDEPGRPVGSIAGVALGSLSR